MPYIYKIPHRLDNKLKKKLREWGCVGFLVVYQIGFQNRKLSDVNLFWDCHSRKKKRLFWHKSNILLLNWNFRLVDLEKKQNSIKWKFHPLKFHRVRYYFSFWIFLSTEFTNPFIMSKWVKLTVLYILTYNFHHQIIRKASHFSWIYLNL